MSIIESRVVEASYSAHGLLRTDYIPQKDENTMRKCAGVYWRVVWISEGELIMSVCSGVGNYTASVVGVFAAKFTSRDPAKYVFTEYSQSD